MSRKCFPVSYTTKFVTNYPCWLFELQSKNLCAICAISDIPLQLKNTKLLFSIFRKIVRTLYLLKINNVALYFETITIIIIKFIKTKN